MPEEKQNGATSTEASPFFTGQSLASVFGTPQAPVSDDTAQQKESPAPSDTDSQEVKLEAAQEEIHDDLPAEEPEIDPLLKKYGNDPKQWARAFRGIQQRTARNEQQTKMLRNQLQVLATMAAQRQDVKEEQPKGTTTPLNVAELSDAEVATLVTKFSDDTTAGVKEILLAARRQGEEGYRVAAQRYEAERQQAEQQRIAEDNNAMAFDRGRELLLERARSEGDTALEKRYSNPNYKLTQEEWDEVFESVNAEYEHIVENYQLRTGRITREHFARAQRDLDPEAYEERIKREAYQKALADLQKGKGDQRLEPSAKKSVAEMKVTKLDDLPPDSTATFEWAMKNPEQARRLLEKQGIR